MRLAFGLGRTVEELNATLTHREWVRWVAFHGMFDLPDGFLVTGQLGALVASGLGSKKARAEHFAPYYKARRNTAAAIRSWMSQAIAYASRSKAPKSDPPVDAPG